MTLHDPNQTTPSTATADTDPPQGRQPDPIVLPVPELLEPRVGPLANLDLRELGDGAFAWNGIDREGRTLSGKLSPHFVVTDAGKGFELWWDLAVWGAPP